MHVVVIGAGLLGVTTAYFLNRHGIDVTVVEKERGPALGASYGNGGYLQASAPDPWNAPGIFRVFAQAWLNSIKGKGDQSAFAVRTLALPRLMGWGVRFLKNANQETFLRHLIKNMHLAQYTKTVIDELNEQESLDYSRSETGGLIIFRSDKSISSYLGVAQHVGEHGARYEVLERDALLAREPALTYVRDDLVGAVYFPDDGAGNSRAFCEQIAGIAENNGVAFRHDVLVDRISIGPGGILVESDSDNIAADAVVIAAGAHSKRLAASVGIKLPIAPAKGYSISIPMHNRCNRPRHVIADMGIHAGVNPMGDTLRVAGTAEFSGFSDGISTARTEYLVDLARQLFPKIVNSVNHDEIDPWGGHRPLSADGIPMIGATGVHNVYVNTGHGGLGWTQSAGSSKALAAKIAGKEPEIDLSEFSVARFH